MCVCVCVFDSWRGLFVCFVFFFLSFARQKKKVKTPKQAVTKAKVEKKVKKEDKDDDNDDVDDDDFQSSKKKEKAKKPAAASSASARKTKRKKGGDEEEDDGALDDDDDDDDDFDDDDDDFRSSSKKKKGGSSKKKKAPASSSAKKKSSTKSKKKQEEEEDGEEEAAAAEESSEDVPLGQLASGKKSSTSGKGEDEDVWEWWKEPPLPAGKKWRTLEHNGVIFPPEYERLPSQVKMLYDGKPLELNTEAEERAYHYARYLETTHVQKEAFRNNFFNEFKEVANKNRPAGAPKLEKMELCDFTPIKAYLDAEKERKKNRTKEEKQKEKEEKKALQDKYGWAVMDGHKQKVGNYMVEPPGLFLGRGAHPKTGTWKKRLTPEDVTINIGKGAKVPPSPMPGHKWGEIVHKDNVTWLAGWQESVQDNFKYVMLSASSRTKGQSDMAKFEKARKLKDIIDKIRKAYTKEFTSAEASERQRSVIIYLIDKLALRVGGEKDTKNQADTVGCCSLRVEHVQFRPPSTIVLDFLGKDSMRFYNEVEVLPAVYECLQKFAKGKKPGDQLFDSVNPSILNDHLKTFMDGLSAKVFRTYNASVTLQRELEGTPEDGTVEEKVAFYNRANKQVALLCNHKRTVPAKFADGLKKLDDEIASIKTEVEDLKAHRKLIKEGKKPLKREKDSEGEEKPAFPTDLERVDAHLEKLQERLHKKEIARTDKEDNAEVALGTSKINYNDPRITAAWCKKYDVPWQKVFSQSLRQKFPWAQMADADWTF